MRIAGSQEYDNTEMLAGMLPKIASAYDRFTDECFAGGELDARTKQLIALGVSLFAGSELCTHYHVQEARSLGASDKAILEAAAVAGAAASGDALTQGILRVQDALNYGSISEQPLLSMVKPDAWEGASRLPPGDLFQTEFAVDPDSDGMDIPDSVEVSPSY